MESNLMLLLSSNFHALDKQLQQKACKDYYNLVYKQVMVMLNDHAATQDLIQEALFKTITKAPPLEDEEQFRAWTRVLIRNLSLNYLKKNKKERNLLPIDDVFINTNEISNPNIISTEKEVEVKLLKEHLSSLIQTMTPAYRIILDMRWKQELTYSEIAEELGTTEDIIRQKLHRARKELRKRFGEKWSAHDE